MIAHVRKAMVVTAVALCASVVHAGDLTPAPNGGGGGNGNTMHPAPQSHQKGIDMATENAAPNSNAIEAVNKNPGGQARRLRPAR